MTIPFDPADAMAVLRRTPDTLRALLSGLPESWLHADEGGDTFSPWDVVAHLLHGERTDWMPRLRIILEHGEARPFEPFDRFAHRTASIGASIDELLEKFEEARQASLAELASLLDGGLDSGLDRAGRHPELGRVTARQLLATWAVHDLGHVRQIARVLAKQYGGEVGPWRAYLPVLSE